ncbi:MAG: glycosyltransferase [Flavobacteriaceae bacterium]
MSILFLCIFGLYGFALVWVRWGIHKLPFFQAEKTPAKNYFSIIVPFRNEASNLPVLLNSLLQLNYSTQHFEVIFIDDESHDPSVVIIQKALKDSPISFRIHANKRYSNAPKKDAITLGVKEAQHEWIVTTDADCQVPAQWLHLLDAYIEAEHPKMIAMPVAFTAGTSWVKQYQLLDGLSLQAVTMGGFGHQTPLLCNGANLAYKKRCFYEVAGFEGNDQFSSGDDIFLMEKMRRIFPGKLHYLKNPSAMVITQSLSSWKEVIQQRVRWASKTRYQKNGKALLLGSVVLLANLAFIGCIFFIFIFPLDIVLFLSFILFKIGIDSLLLWSTSHILQKKAPLFPTLLSGFLYPFVMVWVFLNSFHRGFIWKDRTFKK